MPVARVTSSLHLLGLSPTLAIPYFFFGLVALLLITFWVANRRCVAGEFYCGARPTGPIKNGLALAGNYMSAASFLGVAGLCALKGYVGILYAVGWFAGWPLLLILVGEPLRDLRRFTVTDAVALRFRTPSVRIASGFGGLLTLLFYSSAQMVAAGSLVALLFGISYTFGEIAVTAATLVYLLSGRVFSTTWTQVVKAILMLLSVTALAAAILHRTDFNPTEVFRLAPGFGVGGEAVPRGFWAGPVEFVSLGLALMLGLLGLPHLLTHFFTIPEARVARTSVAVATGLIGFFYCLIPFVGFGAAALFARIGATRAEIAGIDPGGNMVAPLVAALLGGSPGLGFVSVVAFATVLSAMSGLMLSGGFSFSHDIFVPLLGGRGAAEHRQVDVARKAGGVLCLCSGIMGILFEGQNVAFLVGLAFAVAASANSPALLLSLFWRKFTAAGAIWSILTGALLSALLILLGPDVWGIILGHRGPGGAPVGLIPLRNPAIVSVTAACFAGVVASLLTRNASDEALFREQTLRRLLNSAVGRFSPAEGEE